MSCEPYTIALTPTRVPNFVPCGCESPAPGPGPCTFPAIDIKGVDDNEVSGVVNTMAVGDRIIFRSDITDPSTYLGTFVVVGPDIIRGDGMFGEYTIPACTPYIIECEPMIFSGITPQAFDWARIGANEGNTFTFNTYTAVPFVCLTIQGTRMIAPQVAIQGAHNIYPCGGITLNETTTGVPSMIVRPNEDTVFNWPAYNIQEGDNVLFQTPNGITIGYFTAEYTSDGVPVISNTGLTNVVYNIPVNSIPIV